MSKRQSITDGMKYRMLRGYEVRVACDACGAWKPLIYIEFDHHLALVDGGEHTVDNLRPVCAECHSQKSAHEHVENCRAKRRARKHTGQHKSKRPMPKSHRPIPKRQDPWGTQRRKSKEAQS